MGFELTGKKVSLTYNDLVQYISGSYYDGLGNLINITDASVLTVALVQYVSNSSLGSGFYWSNGLLYIDVSVVAGGVTKVYVDGSLASRDSSITYLYGQVGTSISQAYVDGSIRFFSTNASVGLAFYSNASLGLTFNQYSNVSLGLTFNQYTNASLGYVNPLISIENTSIGNLTTNLSKTDASLYNNFLTNASLGLTFNQYTNVSLGYVNPLISTENTSIGNLTTSLSKTDSSLYNNLLTNASLGLVFSQYANASLGLAGSGGLSKAQADASYATNVSVGLAFYSNASLGLTFNQYSNASLGLAFNQFTNASLGLAGTGSGLTRSQIDASYTTNVSVGLAFFSNASLGLSFNQFTNVSLGLAGTGSGLTRSQIDASYVTNVSANTFATNASISLAYFTNASVGNISQLAYALNTSMGTGLTTYATNTSIGLAFYSNASLGLAGSGSGLTRTQIDASYATNASIGLAFASNASLGSSSTKYDKTGGPITGDVSISGILVIGDTTMDTDKLDSFSIYQNESQTDSVNLVKVVGVSDNYLQIYIQNRKNGANASADLVATANNGTEVINYVNVGINSSIFSSRNVGNYNDAYLYSIAQALLIGNASVGTNSNIIFFTNGTNTYANERMRISSVGNVGINQNNPAYPLDVSGVIHTTGSIAIENQKISGLALSVNSSDATNKYYVDSKVNVPFTGNVSLGYTNNMVTSITGNTSLGTKNINIVYDNNMNVSSVTINNFGTVSRQVTFARDVYKNITNMYIN